MDVPVGDPRFGKLEICVCRQRDVSEQVRERLYSLSRLDELQGLTFETFQPRGRKGLGEMQATSIEMAFNQAQHYARNVNGWLLLRGGYGGGKTTSGCGDRQLRRTDGCADPLLDGPRPARHAALFVRQ